jgi:predicted Zn-dependent protease
MPERGEVLQTQEWKTYTRQVLNKLFPQDKRQVDKMDILIASSSIPFARTDGRRLVTSDALIRTLDDGDDGDGEYASIVAHEWYHHFRKSSRVRSKDGRGIKKDEISADAFSMQTLLAAGYDPCLLSKAIERVEVQPFHMREQPELWMNSIVLERLSIAQQACLLMRNATN